MTGRLIGDLSRARAFLLALATVVAASLSVFAGVLLVSSDANFVGGTTDGGLIPDGGSLDLSVPVGVVAGDVLIAQVAYNAPPGSTITPGAGWTSVDVLANPGNDIIQGLYWRVATAAEPASYGFTLNSGSGNTASGGIGVYSGVNTANPIDAFAGQANGPSNTIAAPSIATTQPGTTLIGFFAARAEGAISPPAAMTLRWDIGSNAGVGAAAETQAAAAEERLPAAGPTGPRTAAISATDGSIGHLIALAPAAADFVVNSTGDAGDTAPGNGVCDTGGFNSAFRPLSAPCGPQWKKRTPSLVPDLIGFAMPTGELGHSGGRVDRRRWQPRCRRSISRSPSTPRTQPGYSGPPIVRLDGGTTE